MTKEHWRLFRHYLAEVDDPGLITVFEILQREITARTERDLSILRLFLTSLEETELATAIELLEVEILDRVEDTQQAICESYRRQGGVK